jgi:hypothetical protein
MMLVLLICSGCGGEEEKEDGSCGDYPGRVSFSDILGTDTETCYTSVGADLNVNTTEGPTEVEMPYVESVGGDLTIICNYNLSLLDFGSIEYVKGDVIIEGNRLLASLDGLRSLKYIGGSLIIRNRMCKYPNEQLSDISGLNNLESVSGDIIIEGNPKLPTCAVDALVARLKYFPGIATIESNDSNAICD